MGAVTMSGMRKSRPLRDSVDLLIEPAMAAVGMLDWKYFDAAVEAGYRGAIDALERDWKSTVERELPPNLKRVRRT